MPDEPRPSIERRGVARVEGRHWVSPFNFLPEVTAAFDFPAPLTLIDSTLRKVIYTAGVRPSVADLRAIADVLIEIGVRDESLNVWWWGEDEPSAIEMAAVEALGAARLPWRLNVFTDTLVGDGTRPMPRMRETVDRMAAAGVASLSPGLIEPPDAAAAARQRDQFHALGEAARAAGLALTLTVAQCGRRDFDAMVAGANVAIEAGIGRLDPMDSTSALSPHAMAHFVRAWRARLVRPVPMTMHAHNEFGMMTACAVAAVTAGASPDVALNGVSYRSGFAPLEEVALALDVLYGLDTGIRLDRLTWASERLAALMDFPVPPLKAVVGAHQFLRESPAELTRTLPEHALDAFPQGGSPIDPALVGGRMRWVYGKQASAGLVRAMAAHFGVALAADRLAVARAELDARLAAKRAYPKWLEPDEVEQVLRAVAAG
jgi:isopropylmalate/homocitrate/citramalate synthase